MKVSRGLRKAGSIRGQQTPRSTETATGVLPSPPAARGVRCILDAASVLARASPLAPTGCVRGAAVLPTGAGSQRIAPTLSRGIPVTWGVALL